MQPDEIVYAYQLKGDGAKYCDCPVCKAAQDILEKKSKILNGMRSFLSIFCLNIWAGATAKICLKNAVEELKAMGFKTIFLWLLEENRRARRFYEKCGFKTVVTILTAPKRT